MSIPISYHKFISMEVLSGCEAAVVACSLLDDRKHFVVQGGKQRQSEQSLFTDDCLQQHCLAHNIM